MKKRLIFIVAALATILTIKGQQVEKNIFISPLRDTPSLSASFAELRADHFHSGLDYKTGGVTGKEVSAAADGYIYRISISPSGFGKALYIRHSSGYSTIYAHLDHFRPDIEEYLSKRQYELKLFAVNLYPGRDQFPVKQGEIIAWSGNSGGSTGPHLHFEIRESTSEDPVNPLQFNLGVNDRIRPSIEKVIIYPLTRGSSVNKSHQSLVLRTTGTGGKYTVISQSPVVVNGEIGIGVKCWDTFDNSPNRCGIYSLDLFVDSVKVYGFTAKRFSYSESGYINSHIDYRARIINNEYIHKTYLQPGNRLSMYNGIINRGIISFNDNKEHTIILRLSDASSNTSYLSFSVRSLESAPVAPSEIKYDKVLPYGKASDFTADGIRIHFPATALYDTLFFSYGVRNSPEGLLSPVHSVHNETVAVHGQYRLSIRPDTIIAGHEGNLCLVNIDREGIWNYAGGEYRYGFVSSELRLLGDYAVGIDTVAPSILPSFAKGADLKGKRSLTLTIKDDFSGIKSYEALIDGAWALLEFDAKNSLLIYRPDGSRIRENSLHHMELKVTDNCSNTTTLKTEFIW